MIEEPYKLPADWQWVRLEEVCLPTEKRNPTKTPELEFIYVEISSVDNEQGRIVNTKCLKGKEAPSRARKVIRKADVLFATTRPYLKNIVLVPSELDGQICSTGFCVLRPNEKSILPEYLFYVCRSDIVVNQISLENMRGANYPAVTDDDILGSIIPLPPLPEQRRIVARIEKLMGRIRDARRLREHTHQDVELLWKSTLAKVFPCQGANLPAGWHWVRLGEICTVIMGQSPSSGTYNQERNGIPFFQGKADFGELYPTARIWCSAPKKIAERGDVLISVRAPVGPTNIAKTQCCIGRGLAALRPNHILDPFWLLFYLRSVEHMLAQLGSGSTFNAITKKELTNLTIPLPPLSEQRRIVAHLVGVRKNICAIMATQKETKERLKELERSILDRAFRGEL